MNRHSINVRQITLAGLSLAITIFSYIGVAEHVYASPYYFQNLTAPNSTLITPSDTVIDKITVTTDKSSYNDGDIIAISGNTQTYISDTPITVKIISPMGNIVKVDQLDLGLDKTFSTTIMASRAIWQEVGIYHIIVQFGNKNRMAETTFQFTGSTDATRNTKLVEGTDFSVKYTITNGQVTELKTDTQSKSLLISIQSTGDGILTVTLPRGLIDAKINQQDKEFYVLVDGQEGDFQETVTTKSDRTLLIHFMKGTTEIEIIGTFAIPEFGSIAFMIFAIAIVSIVVISSTTRLRLFSRF